MVFREDPADRKTRRPRKDRRPARRKDPAPKSKNFDYVVSPAYGAIAIGFLAALKLGKKFAFTQRVDEKMSFRSGFTGIDGSRAIIVEDILTTGGSINEVVDCLKRHDVGVAGIVRARGPDGGRSPDRRPAGGQSPGLESRGLRPRGLSLLQKRIPLTKPGASDKKA